MASETNLTLEQLRQELEPLHAELTRINLRLAVIEGQLVGIGHRFAAIEGRLIHLQTFGTWLLAGLLASYVAIFAVALRAIR
jgi:hypothetical protein